MSDSGTNERRPLGLKL